MHHGIVIRQTHWKLCNESHVWFYWHEISKWNEYSSVTRHFLCSVKQSEGTYDKGNKVCSMLAESWKQQETLQYRYEMNATYFENDSISNSNNIWT
jgi:hypothetical protein